MVSNKADCVKVYWQFLENSLNKSDYVKVYWRFLENSLNKSDYGIDF